MKKLIKHGILAFLLLIIPLSAQKVYFTNEEFIIKSSASEGLDQLNNRVSAMFSDPVMRNANWGFVIYDPKTQKVINSYNEKASLIPASTTKLLTTDTAMSILGKDFQWTTQLEYSGEIDDNGILNGNLYIIGSGDPSLGTGKAGASSYKTLISDFSHAIRNLGIKKVKGDIILKTAIFKNNKDTPLPANIVWKNDKNYYLPAGSTNNTDPRQEKLLDNNKIDQQEFIYHSPYNGQLVYTENFNGYSLYTKLPNATFYLANNLKINLSKSGVVTKGKVVDHSAHHSPLENRKKIIHYLSPKLEEIVYFINQTSNNAMSEALLKTTGFYKKGDFSLDTGRATVNKHLTKRIFDFDGFNFADGSGLSRSNVITPISQVKFLSALVREKHFYSYFKSLPIAGQTGTLKSMFQNSDSYGQVFAKTGTLNKVKTLAGYVKTKSGKLLAFSLLINNYNGSVDQIKQKMEAIISPIVDL